MKKTTLIFTIYFLLLPVLAFASDPMFDAGAVEAGTMDDVLKGAATFILTIAGFIIRKYFTFLDEQEQEILNRRVEKAVKNGVRLARRKIIDSNQDVQSPAVKSMIAADATTYVKNQLPGVTKKTEQTAERLERWALSIQEDDGGMSREGNF